jgi:hypothetical protein
MDEFARVVALVAPDRFGRLQGTQLVQAEPTQNSADRRWRYAGLSGNLLAVQRWRRSPSIWSTTAWE